MSKRVYLGNEIGMWMGWQEGGQWHDAGETSGRWEKNGFFGSKNRVPTWWSPALPEFEVSLPEGRDAAAKQLIDAVDDDALPLQGAAWVHSPNHEAVFGTLSPDGAVGTYPLRRGWRCLLVTPEVGLIEQRLPILFRSGKISQAMVIDDIDVVGPNNPMFQLLWKLGEAGPSVWRTRVLQNKDENDYNLSIEKYRGHNRYEYNGCPVVWKLDADDGTIIYCEMRCNAVVYRSLKTVDGSDFRWPTPPVDLAATRSCLPSNLSHRNGSLAE